METLMECMCEERERENFTFHKPRPYYFACTSKEAERCKMINATKPLILFSSSSKERVREEIARVTKGNTRYLFGTQERY
jgi:hypothetical protein